MKENRTAVVVSSCDYFEDCWKPFIFSILKYWDDCPFHIYIISNFKDTDTPDNISFLKVGEDRKFSSNLKKALNQIDAEYIIYMQEDYWLNNPVNTASIVRHINYCEQNAIDYMRLTFPYLKGKETDAGYREHTLNQKYSICLQAAVWKRASLISLLRDGDTGWDFEYGIPQYALSNNMMFKVLSIPFEKRAEGIRYVKGTAVRKGLWTKEGYEFLIDNGFNEFVDHRGREGRSYGALVDNNGPFRLVCLALGKIMKLLKLNF